MDRVEANSQEPERLWLSSAVTAYVRGKSFCSVFTAFAMRWAGTEGALSLLFAETVRSGKWVEAPFAVIGGPTVLRIGAVPRTPERSQKRTPRAYFTGPALNAFRGPLP